ncbi:MAG: TIGR03790 family protein, partial [Gammaproteobacteria bacterium]|nr:TIGR03790 family protein [Gammaproteobacteria bacterium]
VQAFVLTWTSPYRVGCMSITTAFAAGFDPAFCAQGCARTLISPYFNSTSRRPHDDHGWRPAMMLAAGSLGETKELIDRGVAADGTYPIGTAYLLNTTDRARNVRSLLYPATLRLLDWRLEMEVIKEDYIKGKDDVLFYFTGLKRVPHLNSNRFLPGAIADHLTSSGGKLTGSRQMNSIEWLHAGATGSYGAVVEPCAFPQKFPIPAIVIDRYLRGETLIEAYWKSVAWPGQGVFIGEPLAKPFKIGK